MSKRPTRFGLSGWGETIDRIVSVFKVRMLVEENRNFRGFLKNIADDVKLGKVKSSYDSRD
ncbi:hypothetical protein NUH30_16940 [Leptospira sp. 85282-16]|uniref:hypothetical protein n=1 Tax=Leptospira sp. 85282-16 TaxID=2971256 RepID=UPI0021C0B675|nr:hypothetical protein [Leptospira sp. 85282-16]MCT8335371.1 hypothetical protein [Leptospira sp. 85282-16]